MEYIQYKEKEKKEFKKIIKNAISRIELKELNYEELKELKKNIKYNLKILSSSMIEIKYKNNDYIVNKYEEKYSDNLILNIVKIESGSLRFLNTKVKYYIEVPSEILKYLVIPKLIKVLEIKKNIEIELNREILLNGE